MPRFGKDKDSSRNEELDRQAAEEVERLLRRGGPPGMGAGEGGGGMPGGPMGRIRIPSPLEQIAEEVRDAPRPGMRRMTTSRKTAPGPPQQFTPLPSGGVGSSFGPGGLNPGPRGAGAMPPPPAFGGGAYDEDFGGPVDGPPVFHAEPDEDEEMTITEMALMDHAQRRGYDPEDLVMRYDAGTAEEMRDAAMRQFYERQQSRRPGQGTNNPFAPAGMRGGPAGAAPLRRGDDPAAAGGALAQRLANKRRREEEEARKARAAAEPERAPAAAPTSPAAAPRAAAAPAAAKAGAVPEEGALARVLARRRAALGIDEPAPAAEAMPPEPRPEREPEPRPAPGRRHAQSRAESSPGLRAVPVGPAADDEPQAAVAAEAEAPAPARRSTRKAAGSARGPAAKKAAAAKKKAPGAKKAATRKAPTRKAAAKPAPADEAPAAEAPPTAGPPPAATAAKAARAAKAAKAAKVPRSGKGGASLATKAPAKKAPAAKKVGKAKTVFCIECGEKNPAIAKFCFNCGTRLAAPE